MAKKKVVGLKADVKPIKTHVCFIVDRSGSMATLAPQYVSLYNDQVKDHQLRAVGEVTGTLVFFNDKVREAFCMQPIENLSPITVSEFNPGGMTAMYDAVGETVSKLRAWDKRDENVAFLIIILSDGLENASVNWSGARLQSMIRELENTGRWTFQYLGCEADAIAQSKTVGLTAGLQFTASPIGLKHLGMAMTTGNARMYAARAGGQHVSTGNYVTQDDLQSVSEESDAK